ncbi:response regulator transcription factor, partial [Thermodesulfobacteriota bacterium]
MSQKRKPKVLIADDEAHIRMLIEQIMKSMGTEIVGMAKNGQEAIDLFRKMTPDLLLMDVNMPIVDGVDALREIVDEFPDAFIIMMTSVTDRDTIEKCINFG